MGKIIGIDLGTTNSCVSILDGETGEIIENQEGERTTPSIIAFTEDGEILVGDPAKRQAVTNSENTLYAIKRLIGRRFDDEQVQEFKDVAPFKIIEAENGDAWVEIKGVAKAPSEISAQILKKLKEAAEEYLNEEITEAVITVPAYFNENQRTATINAGKIAGLDVKRIINEPTAAALSYGLNQTTDKTIIVYDLGGGTFDVSVLDISDDNTIAVISTNGDTFLGGEDFDNRIINHLCDEFAKENDGIDLRKDPNAIGRVKEAAEDAKKELSSAKTTNINLPYVTVGPDGPKHMDIKLTRAVLEELVRDLVEKTVIPCQKALADAGFTADDIDEVLLVGGMTRMPMVKAQVEAFFGAGKYPSKKVNPDEVVSTGAAVQGGILTGDIDALLMDVTPLSLGLRTAGGANDVVIPRNTTIPFEAKQTYSTFENNQTEVQLNITQGESPMADGNNQLGKFTLDGIPLMPKATPQIEVSFKIDANGVLEVSAKELSTGVEQNTVIEAGGGLTDEQVEAMVQKAEDSKEDDQKRADKINVTNESEAVLMIAEKTFTAEYYMGAPNDAQTNYREAFDGLKTAIESGNTDDMKVKQDVLDKSTTALGEAFAEVSKAKIAEKEAKEAEEKAKNEDNNDVSAENDNDKTETVTPKVTAKGPKNPGA